MIFRHDGATTICSLRKSEGTQTPWKKVPCSFSSGLTVLPVPFCSCFGLSRFTELGNKQITWKPLYICIYHFFSSPFFHSFSYIFIVFHACYVCFHTFYVFVHTFHTFFSYFSYFFILFSYFWNHGKLKKWCFYYSKTGIETKTTPIWDIWKFKKFGQV